MPSMTQIWTLTISTVLALVLLISCSYRQDLSPLDNSVEIGPSAKVVLERNPPHKQMPAGDDASLAVGAPVSEQVTPHEKIEAELIVNQCRFFLEIADSADERRIGLMNRAVLEDDRGMLFEFPSETYLSFWMHRTLIPLDIIFLNQEKVVVDIQHMDTELAIPSPDLKTYTSVLPAKYALEINAGRAGDCVIQIGIHLEYYRYR